MYVWRYRSFRSDLGQLLQSVGLLNK